MNNDIDQARQQLDQAREAQAAALVARYNAPNDPNTRQQLREAVQQGRGAWKGYQQAATAGLADQISAIIPGEFQAEI